MAGSKSGTPPDPLGKRALYGVPAGDGPAEPTPSASWGDGPYSGKRALYSDALAGTDAPPGRFTVRCQRCQRVSRVGVLELVILQFPVGMWFPRGRFDRRMTCPSCRRRAWCSVTLRRG